MSYFSKEKLQLLTLSDILVFLAIIFDLYPLEQMDYEIDYDKYSDRGHNVFFSSCETYRCVVMVLRLALLNHFFFHS